MSELFQRTITALCLAFVYGITFFYLPPVYFTVLLLLTLAIILCTEWPHLLSPRSYIFWLLTPLYPVLPFILIILLNQDPYYRPLLILMFLGVFGQDMGGYFVGKAIGHHKIAPHISPGKSWEGFIGGYILSVLLLTLYLWNQPISWFFVCGLVFSINALALCGDLFESYFKRRVGLKDSGWLLPGHGGFLDRVDGFLLTSLLIFCVRNYIAPLIQA